MLRSLLIPAIPTRLSQFLVLSSLPRRCFAGSEEARNMRVGEYFSLERGTAVEQAVIYRISSFAVVARGRGGTSIKFKLEDVKSGRTGIEHTLGTGGTVKRYSKEEVLEIQADWAAKKSSGIQQVDSSLPRPSVPSELPDDSTVYNFLYFDPKSNSAHFMHPESFDQIEIGFSDPIYSSVAFSETTVKALKENSQVKFLKKTGKIIGIEIV